jgi:hypothetical protein
MNRPELLLIVILMLYSCGNNVKTTAVVEKPDSGNVSVKDSNPEENPIEKTLRSIPKTIRPVFGYRFNIQGDFDGDGKKEKLTEHFCSSLDNKETNKFYDSLAEYDQLVALTIVKEPFSFVKCSNKGIDTLHIADRGQLLGLSYLKNEGDLNGDGTDDVSYVVNWADFSNWNTWHIVTFRNHKWEELYAFPIWDWQLPDLPETWNDYYLFGLRDKVINTNNDSVNQLIEKNLLGFKGLVKKAGQKRIRVIFRNDEAELDTMFVNLKKKK